MGARLGAHVSIAGGLVTAIERGVELGCATVQIFVKSPNRWRGRPLRRGEARAFRAAHAESPIGPVVAHGSYLINLAASQPQNLRRSRSTLADELRRCQRLGITGLVVHPGAHLGAGHARGIQEVAVSLRRVLSARSDAHTRVLLENTAGQGTVLGHRLEHLEEIRRQSGLGERIGICIDTCHAFAAGYPLHEAGGYADFWAEVEVRFGLGRLGCLHLNDSHTPFGSRRDRHANLGAGAIGRQLFERLVNDPRLRRVPMIIETPAGKDRQRHRQDLALLRSLVA